MTSFTRSKVYPVSIILQILISFQLSYNPGVIPWISKQKLTLVDGSNVLYVIFKNLIHKCVLRYVRVPPSANLKAQLNFLRKWVSFFLDPFPGEMWLAYKPESTKQRERWMSVKKKWCMCPMVNSNCVTNCNYYVPYNICFVLPNIKLCDPIYLQNWWQIIDMILVDLFNEIYFFSSTSKTKIN